MARDLHDPVGQTLTGLALAVAGSVTTGRGRPMTEAEWLGDEPEAMLALVAAGGRKPRLAACACARLVWHHLDDDRSRQAVAAAERFADGAAGYAERAERRRQAEAAADDAHARRNGYPGRVGYARAYAAWAAEFAAAVPAEVEDAVARAVSNALACGRSAGDGAAGPRAVAAVLREVFGNPFRPVAFDPNWRTDTAVALARQMYEAREFGAMPILADALQDAGCDDEEVLGHCRDTSLKHVRGCWVVDLVLGRE